MTRMPAFNSPFLLGFDHFERALDRISKASTESYPPYNIVQTAPNALRITLAVAGFREADIAITLENRQLVIRGQQEDPGPERVFLHRGIATRQFRRAFALAEGVEVLGASLEHGLLTITLQQREPEAVVRSIPINHG